MKNKKILIITILLSLFIVVSTPVVANALQLIPPACKDQTIENKYKCTLNDFEQLFANAYTIGIVYVGALAVLFIIVGGFMLLVSHGRQDRVDLGKQIISHTIIGVVIVMTAFLLISIIQKQLFQADEKYLIRSGNTCADKKDGDACTGPGTPGQVNSFTGNFVCYQGQCALTKCEYYSKILHATGFYKEDTKEEMTCMDKTKCDPATIQSNYCPGDNNIKCCFPQQP